MHYCKDYATQGRKGSVWISPVICCCKTVFQFKIMTITRAGQLVSKIQNNAGQQSPPGIAWGRPWAGQRLLHGCFAFACLLAFRRATLLATVLYIQRLFLPHPHFCYVLVGKYFTDVPVWWCLYWKPHTGLSWILYLLFPWWSLPCHTGLKTQAPKLVSEI